jgi:hypothetical protein
MTTDSGQAAHARLRDGTVARTVEDALVSGGVVQASGSGWLLPGAVACFGLSWLLSLLG